MDIAHLLSVASDVGVAALAILGGLKVIARYTPWAGDDKILAAIEAPLKAILSFLKK